MINSMKTYKLISVSLCIAIFGLFFSCTDVFTTSLGTWAQRDPSSLIPKVTKSNVQELIALTENSPDQSLALLYGIADAANGNPALQAAALQAAANASGFGAALLKHAGNIDEIDQNNAGDYVADAIKDMSNLGEVSDVLLSTLPNPASPAWNDFVESASAEDLAIAAAVLLAAEAKKSGDPAAYISASPPAIPSDAFNLAEDLATAAAGTYTGGGFLNDLLDGLGLL
jgi:hypothetical protein